MTLALACVGAPAIADWLPAGNSVTNADRSQSAPVLTRDGTDGVYVAWYQAVYVGGGDYRVRALRFSPFGEVGLGWPVGGVVLCDEGLAQVDPKSCAGPDGITTVWLDSRNGSPGLYAQRITSTGVVPATWPSGGLAITGSRLPSDYEISGDGRSDCYIAWDATLAATGAHEVRLQHVLPNGMTDSAWPDTGVVLFGQTDELQRVDLSGDGVGGALVAWAPWMTPALYFERRTPNSSRATGWPAGGLLVSGPPGSKVPGSIVPSKDGGALIVWQDLRADLGDIYATRITAIGEIAQGWPAGGLAICAAAGEQRNPSACSDGKGGLFVVWGDDRSGSAAWDLYAQHVTAQGSLVTGWPPDGLPVSTQSGNALRGYPISDETGGMIVCWTEVGNSADPYDQTGFAQRIDESGNARWGPPQVGLLLPANSSQYAVGAPVSDGASGAYVAISTRDQSAQIFRVFVQRITAAGVIAPGPPIEEFSGGAPYPNPSARLSTMRFVLRHHSEVDASLWDVSGRLVRTLSAGTMYDAGSHSLFWDGRDDRDNPVRAGIYFLRVRAAGTTHTTRVIRVR